MEKPKQKPRKTEQGMTLIEIMIVLAIIALVMGFLIGPMVIKNFRKAKIKTAWMEAKELASQDYGFWQADKSDDEGDCPANLLDVAKYGNKKDIKDPWGHDFIMKCGDDAPSDANGFGVISRGPDGKEGTSDDIHSWDSKPKG